MGKIWLFRGAILGNQMDSRFMIYMGSWFMGQEICINIIV